jgi:RimJ/RimL family protein N-acetyltransferase
MDIRLRPVGPDDLVMFQRFAVEPGLIGLSGSWETGIVLLPEWRGKGIGWRAQSILCDYLFLHTPAQRIQAATHPENIAEQKSLEKAGFQLEGVMRAVEFRAGQWRDGYMYSGCGMTKDRAACHRAQVR